MFSSGQGQEYKGKDEICTHNILLKEPKQVTIKLIIGKGWKMKYAFIILYCKKSTLLAVYNNACNMLYEPMDDCAL